MSTLVVIPTFDEAATITRVLDRVLAAAPQAEVLVVDDSSPDGTAQLVAAHPQAGRRVHLLVRPGKGGLGAAYRAGLGHALEAGYDAVVQLDADLSHPPEAVPALLAALEHADVAIGSRYVPGGRTRGWPLRRELLSRAGNAYVRLVLGLEVHDATAGFRAYRASRLRTIGVLRTQADGYCFQVETTWRAERLGLRVVEVPITFTEREAGQSKMSGAIVAEAVVRVLGWRLRELAGPHRATPARHGLRPAR